MSIQIKEDRIQKNQGFTLIEAVVGAAVFIIIAVGAYGAFANLFKLAHLNQSRLLAVHLANEQMEIIRNLPYEDIGLLNGVPSGSIPPVQTINRGGIDFKVTTTIRNIDLEFDGTIGDPVNTDFSPADNKSISVDVSCASCTNFTDISVSGQLAPKRLEASSGNGSIFIQVFDSSGNPIEGATVLVEDVSGSNEVNINDLTNTEGLLKIIDIPPGNNRYHIKVTKAGYSTEETNLPDAMSNPSPTKPHATVLTDRLTIISFAIDRLSSFNVSSVNMLCAPEPNFSFVLKGAKQIGANISKYEKVFTTNMSGTATINNLEWDNYTLISHDDTHQISGTNPVSPVLLFPNNNQNLQLTVTPKNGNSILLKIIDAGTGLPVSGSSVNLLKDGYDKTKTSGLGQIIESDWSGGSGEELKISGSNKYFADDGRIDVVTVPGTIRLKNVFGEYNNDGVLESATFDTGELNNFYSLSWLPADQPLSLGPNSVKYQFATNKELTATTTWDFIGPDGTNATFYTVSDSPIHLSHAGSRYARYRIYLSTADSMNTPSISDISFIYTNSCIPPGQVIFTGLDADNYTMKVNKAGYSSISEEITVGSGWQELTVYVYAQ